MDRFFRELFGFVDAEMFIASNVHQEVIAFSAFGMDNALRRNLAPDDGLKRFGQTVHQLAEDRRRRRGVPQDGELVVDERVIGNVQAHAVSLRWAGRPDAQNRGRPRAVRRHGGVGNGEVIKSVPSSKE